MDILVQNRHSVVDMTSYHAIKTKDHALLVVPLLVLLTLLVCL